MMVSETTAIVPRMGHLLDTEEHHGAVQGFQQDLPSEPLPGTLLQFLC